MLTLTVAFAAACGSATARTDPADPADDNGEVGAIVVSAENRSSSPVTIYAVRGTIRQRIGSVAGNSQADVLLPASLTNDRGGVMLEVRQIAGSERYLSEMLAPARGDRVALIIQPRLSASSTAIR